MRNLSKIFVRSLVNVGPVLFRFKSLCLQFRPLQIGPQLHFCLMRTAEREGIHEVRSHMFFVVGPAAVGERSKSKQCLAVCHTNSHWPDHKSRFSHEVPPRSMLLCCQTRYIYLCCSVVSVIGRSVNSHRWSNSESHRCIVHDVLWKSLTWDSKLSLPYHMRHFDYYLMLRPSMGPMHIPTKAHINCKVKTRDAPIIGIGRLLCRYRPIVIYYVSWWHWILKLYFF